MSKREKNRVIILMADDDPDDRYLAKTAFEESEVACDVQFVENGVEVLEYLERCGKYEEVGDIPHLILLDLNMPRKDGKQVLRELKESSLFRHIPVIIFSTSKSPEEIRQLYLMGANSFISKPSSFDKLLEVTRTIGQYWVNTATLY
jgi:CheY-like chemotaxis protein